MNTPTLAIVLFAAALLIGCGKSVQAPSANGYQVTISGLRTERTESRTESLKKTSLKYETKANVELRDATRGMVSGLLYLQYSDETGLDSGNTGPQFITIVVDHGVGEIPLSITKSIPDGQAMPPPPKYKFSVAAVDPYELGNLIVSHTSSEEGKKSETATFQLIAQQVRVVDEDDSYASHMSMQVKGLDSAPKDPMLLMLRMKTISHPTKENIGRIGYLPLLMVNGESTTDVTEFLALNYEYSGSDYEKVPTAMPEPPQYEFSLVGFYRAKPATVTQKP